MGSNGEKINKSAVIKFGFLGGVAQAAYCLVVALFFHYSTRIFPQPPAVILTMLLVLLIFVFSAAVSGILVFGYPAYLAFQRRFTEAVLTALITLATLAVLIIFGISLSIFLF